MLIGLEFDRASFCDEKRMGKLDTIYYMIGFAAFAMRILYEM